MRDIVLSGVTKRYGELTVLDSLTVTFRGGHTTALTGASGSGKTTLLRLIAGLEKADLGTIDGTQGEKIAYMFQEDRLFFNFSVYDNIICTGLHEQTEEIINACGCSDFTRKLPGEISGGMSRRVSLARALNYRAGIILLDEPFTGLDDEKKGDIIRNIAPYLRQRTVILVTHDSAERALADILISL